MFDLRNGIPELRPKEDSHCFSLVEHLGDKSFMSAVAQQLTGKCKDSHFYGRYGGEWEIAKINKGETCLRMENSKSTKTMY